MGTTYRSTPSWPHRYAMSFDPPPQGASLGFLIAHLRYAQSVVARPLRAGVGGNRNPVLWLCGLPSYSVRVSSSRAEGTAMRDSPGNSLGNEW